jgi:hypothetical protein
MLSALPVASAQSISFGEVATPLSATGAGNFVLRTSIADLGKLTALGGFPVISITNDLGTSTTPAGITVSATGGAATAGVTSGGLPPVTASDGGLDGEPPGLFAPLKLDPILGHDPLTPPETAPIASPLPPSYPIAVNGPTNPVSTPDPSGASKSTPTTLLSSGPIEIIEPISADIPAPAARVLAAPAPGAITGMITVASAVTSTTAANATSATTSAVSSYSPRWLSATFSAAEEHQLDSQADESHFAQFLAARDPQARPALEPTRISVQAFVVALPELAALVEGTGDQDALQAVQQHGIASQDRAAARHVAQAGGSSQPGAWAVHDAAILEWDGTQQPARIAIADATQRGQATVDQQEPSLLERAMPADDQWASLQGVADMLNENKQMLAALAAEIAVASLWLRRPNGEKPLPQGLAPAATKQSPKKRVARRLANADRLPRLPR